MVRQFLSDKHVGTKEISVTIDTLMCIIIVEILNLYRV